MNIKPTLNMRGNFTRQYYKPFLLNPAENRIFSNVTFEITQLIRPISTNLVTYFRKIPIFKAIKEMYIGLFPMLLYRH